MIEAVIERCAGIDVGRRFVVVCMMLGEANAVPLHEIRKFFTLNKELEELRKWLEENQCTHVVMESTGSYWKPIFHVLDDGKLQVVLANSQQVKNLRGHKTDRNDSRWPAHLLRHGMIRRSFIPPREVRELRDLTRRRKQLSPECGAFLDWRQSGEQRERRQTQEWTNRQREPVGAPNPGGMCLECHSKEGLGHATALPKVETATPAQACPGRSRSLDNAADPHRAEHRTALPGRL